MSHPTPSRPWHAVLRWCLAIETLALAVMLCVLCAQIYFEGNAPANLTDAGVHIQDVYTRPGVIAKLRSAAPAGICWLLMLAVTLLTRPSPAPRRLSPDPESALRLLLPRVEVTQEMQALRRRRALTLGILGGVMGMSACLLGLYLFDRAHFTSWDLEKVMGEMLMATWLPALLGLSALMAATVFLHSSRKRELALARKAPRRVQKADGPRRVSLPLLPIRVSIALIAAVLVALGIQNGGMFDVLVKAINICTECIGLG